MGLEPKFSKDELTKMIAARVQRIETAILLRLQRIGEQFVTDARLNGTYKDRTGNLRSSIGYIVLKNGEQYSEGGFTQVKTGKDGKAEASKVLDAMPLLFPKGYVLVVVAGMKYAAAVESGYRGKDANGKAVYVTAKDVLTGSSKKAVSSLKTAIKRIDDKVGGISLNV